MSTDTTVLLPPNRSGGKCWHHPTPDSGRPLCGGDNPSKKTWREVPPDHPALVNRRECQQCKRRLEDSE